MVKSFADSTPALVTSPRDTIRASEHALEGDGDLQTELDDQKAAQDEIAAAELDPSLLGLAREKLTNSIDVEINVEREEAEDESEVEDDDDMFAVGPPKAKCEKVKKKISVRYSFPHCSVGKARLNTLNNS